LSGVSIPSYTTEIKRIQNEKKFLEI